MVDLGETLRVCVCVEGVGGLLLSATYSACMRITSCFFFISNNFIKKEKNQTSTQVVNLIEKREKTEKLKPS